jgi:16S rRNA (adenine1518-N6/adenine1519-N6)-dimethyltransferase
MNHDIPAKKSLGQNFLKDEKILNQIIEAGELTEQDVIMEVGPGKGALTTPLLERVKKLISVELDDRLLPLLKMEFGKISAHPQKDRFVLIHGDALTVDPPNEPYKLIANIPYYITSPLINHFLREQFEKENGNPPEIIVIMIQKEVAQKILAPNNSKGSPKHSVLSLQVYLFGEPEIVCIVPKEAFSPTPKVSSAVLKIRVNKEPKIALKSAEDYKDFFWLLHAGFAQKRKKLANNLGAAYRKKPAEIKEWLSSLKIDPEKRAEELSLEEWEKLYKSAHLS